MDYIDSIQINFNPQQLFLLNICLAFLMFGVALDLRLDNFKKLLQQPKGPLVGLTSQLVLLPLLTLGLIALFRPPASRASAAPPSIAICAPAMRAGFRRWRRKRCRSGPTQTEDISLRRRPSAP